MSSNTEIKRPLWVIPTICFLIGLLIGWWAIGWWLWPVQWTNALPADLRAGERDQYLAMVAESFAASRNADLAKDRLKSWAVEDLATHLANLQTRAGAGTPQAAQAQALADLVGAGKPAGPGPQTPAKGPTSALRPTPSPSAGPDVSSTVRGIGTVLLWLLFFAFAIAVAYFLWMRWRAAHQTPRPAAIDMPTRPARPAASVQHALDEVAAEAKERWISDDRLPEAEADAWTEEEAIADEPPAAPAPRVAPPVAAPGRPSVTASGGATPPKILVAGGTSPAGAFTRAGEYRALYQMGEPDYDEAFDINDAVGGYLGQCGLELNDPIGRGHDQAAALQAWLWDTNDPDTKVKVLMSEGAYRDTALRDQLKGEHDAIPVRAGAEFELETYKVLLRGLVEKVEYADQDPPYTIFSELLVRFRVERKA
ncbi:MAG: hypothetical protein QG637_1440 [Chloroflexota bacterium]|nr:hypothetical protein [Chloroflexota bacterium]